ncbi:hypothetical protein ZHAS_00004571 [Anopheles sinensis]|uniref:Uncharacterized protein n=1 Tax=Anopheles sinensis TaxID=74873 RepID=A0A084VHJ3_ANOSI|nr:hypothetical protein ZHAS_00004571 [Anopheles sinensis]
MGLEVSRRHVLRRCLPKHYINLNPTNKRPDVYLRFTPSLGWKHQFQQWLTVPIKCHIAPRGGSIDPYIFTPIDAGGDRRISTGLAQDALERRKGTSSRLDGGREKQNPPFAKPPLHHRIDRCLLLALHGGGLWFFFLEHTIATRSGSNLFFYCFFVFASFHRPKGFDRASSSDRSSAARRVRIALADVGVMYFSRFAAGAFEPQRMQHARSRVLELETDTGRKLTKPKVGRSRLSGFGDRRRTVDYLTETTTRLGGGWQWQVTELNSYFQGKAPITECHEGSPVPLPGYSRAILKG